MTTLLQKKFTEDMAKHIVCYLYPEFSDIIDEFYFNVSRKYSWVTINAKRPAKRVGVDNRTPKERRRNKPTFVHDTREIIEEAYEIDMGINNHNSTGLWGNWVRENHVKEALKSGNIKYYTWNFSYSYGAGVKLTAEQQQYIQDYLIKQQNIPLPTVKEFLDYYYSD